MKNNSDKPKQIHGGRNLIILGISATVIAITSTAVSLYIYRATGDIYLDRSRPGYISEDEKREDEEKIGDDFSSEGSVDSNILKEYLDELKIVESRIDAHKTDFSGDQLSDDALGIYVYPDDEDY